MNPLYALPLVFAGLTLSASAAEEPPKYVTDARASVERRRLCHHAPRIRQSKSGRPVGSVTRAL